MKKIKFGFTQIANETPAYIKSIYRTIFFLSGFWIAVIEPRVTLSEHTLHMIDASLSCASFGIYYICQYFGIELPSPEEMRVKQAVIEEGEKAIAQRINPLPKDNQPQQVISYPAEQQ